MPPCPSIHRFKHTWTFGSKDKKGYMVVNFRGKAYKVHRLVAETFIPNPLGLPTVDHYPDRNPSNNAVSNLRWADRKMQNNNRQICEDSLAKYGVRKCEDKRAYKRAYYANHPEYAERKRTRERERYENNPEYAERKRARNRKWETKQRELGRRHRTCPDGKKHWLTDSEFEALYG